MTRTVVKAKALSHNIAHRGTQAALKDPRGGMERLPFMDEPRWKALTEKHTVDYCAWDHPYKKPENIWVSDGSPQALPVMVDATVTATLVLSGLTQGGKDTLRYCQGQRARAQQDRGLRGRRMQYMCPCSRRY